MFAHKLKPGTYFSIPFTLGKVFQKISCEELEHSAVEVASGHIIQLDPDMVVIQEDVRLVVV